MDATEQADPGFIRGMNPAAPDIEPKSSIQPRKAVGGGSLKQLFTLILAAFVLAAQMRADELEKNFAAPPASAKPLTFWFQMNGNITKPGITADLEAMKEIGLGGTLLINAVSANPTGLVETKVSMSPAWQDCFQHMLNESARLGLDFGSVFGTYAGNAGGPQISPELAMQQLTWSETCVHGGETVEIAKLPQPESLLDYYRDIAVVAFPTPTADRMPAACSKKKVALKQVPGGFAEVRFDLDAPVRVRELALKDVAGLSPYGNVSMTVEASDDGKTWREVKKFPCSWRGKPLDLTVVFEPTTAQHFRLLLPQGKSSKADRIQIGEATLSNRDRIHLWQVKSGAIAHPEHGGGADRYLDEGASDTPGIAPSSIVVLTGKAKWVAPEGDWTVLRIGHTPTGARNYAPGIELECDKLNPRGIDAQQAAFVDKMLASATPAGKSAFKFTWIDSWEVGTQNWTGNFAEEFRKRSGYDITPWLPVLAGGYIIDSRDKSERFLWDFRRTIADLIVDNYWKRSMELAGQRGMEFRAEPAGRQQFLYDPMNFARACDVPSGEFWVGGGPRLDCKVAASAAHLSGRQIAGAEAFTKDLGDWTDYPWSLKTLGDRAFCLGVNQYYFHRYTHQPWMNLAPGMTFGPWGINLERTNTWWKPGRAWMEYITRCQSLLRQGRFVADALVMLDEGAPSQCGWRDQLTIPLPAGYDYDFANLDALKELKVEKGVLVHKNGMRYRVLVLPATGRATPELMREVLRLVEAGAVVAAPRPLTRAQGLTPDEEISSLWNKITATGNVVITETFDAVEKKLGLVPDFAHDGHDELLWIHRTDDKGADWYFVSNQGDRDVDIPCTFRVAGRRPELWDAATGQMRDAPQFEERDGRTTMRIPFDPRGSWFVVFRKEASAKSQTPSGKNRIDFKTIQEIAGPWEVSFDRKRGGVEKPVTFDKLVSWSENTDPGIQFFSGTATYRKTFSFDRQRSGIGRVYLDLGDVEVIAEVVVNGKSPGVVWKRPFRVDITDVLKDGNNELEIRVSNLWVNRLIGDAKKMGALGVEYSGRKGLISKWPDWVTQDAPPAGAPVSFATCRQWNGDEPLQPSGLIGPVTLQTAE